MSQRIRRQLRRARRQAGMTLLEIMIVLVILALVVGLVLVPNLTSTQAEAEVKITRTYLEEIVEKHFPMWGLKDENRGKQCPETPDSLAKAIGKPLQDAWGRPIEFLCGPSLPAFAQAAGKRAAAHSYGADGQANNGDDLWYPKQN